ncbi:MAG: hypothetical protein D6712_19680 [Chloroflexi bacterium]|nr:MAG: hypothetical protein D6712_19680 [Chloroflexota bacterium]
MKNLVTFFAFLLLLVPIAQAQEDTETPDYPLAWPPAPITDEQLIEARSCSVMLTADNPSPLVETLLAQAGWSIEFLDSIEMPETPCEQMQLAMAYMQLRRHDDETIPPRAIEAYSAAMQANPALALNIDIFISGLSNTPVIAPPNFTESGLARAVIHYDFPNGTFFDIVITPAEEGYRVVGESERAPLPDEYVVDENGEPIDFSDTYDTIIDAALVDSLSSSLVNLVPIDQTFTDQPCWHFYHDWRAELTFNDGTTIEMGTYDSNLYYIGGPWQVKIGEQIYVQMSADFISALLDIVDAVELPLGFVMSGGCSEPAGPLNIAFNRDQD